MSHGLGIMNVSFEGTIHEFREVLCRTLGCSKPKPKVRLLVVEIEGEDEPIPNASMRVKLSKPIKPGQRRRVNITPDEKVDKRADGTFAAIEAVEGDSTVIVRPESTEDKIRLFVNGDGTLGTGKVARVVADGHVGEGEATISLELEWDVVHPDATQFNPAIEEEGADEDIPA